MNRKRRSFGASFKSKVALAAVRGEKTTAEFASEFGVYANQISSWKKQLLDGVLDLFADGRRRKPLESSANEQELYEQIGHLKKWRSNG